MEGINVRRAIARAEINRGIAAGRAYHDVRRVDAAVADLPRRAAARFRAERLAEYWAEYETRAWGYVALGMALGAAITGIAVGLLI